MAVGIINEPRKYVYLVARWLRSPAVKTLRQLFIVYSTQMNKAPSGKVARLPRGRLTTSVMSFTNCKISCHHSSLHGVQYFLVIALFSKIIWHFYLFSRYIYIYKTERKSFSNYYYLHYINIEHIYSGRTLYYM